MELLDLILSITEINFKEEPSQFSTKIELALRLFKSFNEKNESSFHFTYKADEVLGEMIYSLLDLTITHLNKRDEFKELKNSIYSLACSCFNTIRILSRDTDVIVTFQNEKILKLIQKTVDLSDWKMKQVILLF